MPLVGCAGPSVTATAAPAGSILPRRGACLVTTSAPRWWAENWGYSLVRLSPLNRAQIEHDGLGGLLAATAITMASFRPRLGDFRRPGNAPSLGWPPSARSEERSTAIDGVAQNRVDRIDRVEQIDTLVLHNGTASA